METSDIEGFFREAPVQITDNERLREPQRHAHEAVLRHFAGSHAHAMLQIPVGCGKTGVMGCRGHYADVYRAMISASVVE